MRLAANAVFSMNYYTYKERRLFVLESRRCFIKDIGRQ
ncbi:hypothetical protein CES86_4686 [Brucella lupini]|uniref:Uncharacterized protein n=1 Tax=Brucella lupini TaxID=255457 RepID=A0A256GBT1_9HYPH|nr:hypothetical protein CES86_4686 [Brucella lupini]